MPDKVKSLQTVDNGRHRPRARLDCAKLVRNGQRNIKNLIKRRPTRAEAGLAGKEWGVRRQEE